MNKPKLILAMDPARTEHVLSATAMTRLAELTDILDPAPLLDLDGPRARNLLARTEILLTGWGCPRIGAAVLDRAPNLRLVAHSAGTVKFLLAPDVFERGVAVTHAAEANAQPVAEFTLAAILLAGKRAFHFQHLYTSTASRTATDPLLSTPIGNCGRVVGIIGASRIGRRVMALLKPFGNQVLLADPFVSEVEAIALGARKVELDDLLTQADIVTLHAPVLPATLGMIGARELSLLKDGASFINTARGALVDQDALVAQLQTGRIDAVIDVTDPEVPPPTSPLYHLPNVFLTPHIAGAIGLERARLGDMVVDEIARFVAGQSLVYGLDLDMLERLA